MSISCSLGLGKNRDGMTAAIKVKKREDGLGLGMVQTHDAAGNHGWGATTTSYNAVLELLKETYGKPVKKKKAKIRTKIQVGIKYVHISMDIIHSSIYHDCLYDVYCW